ncbi:MAG: type II toxin-antitoxin system HicB family antitoxin [Comamonas sp.]
MLAYPVELIPDEGGFMVTFPDFPGTFSAGETREEALAQAEDALEAALEFLIRDRAPIPAPSKARRGQERVALPALVAAKVLLARTMQEQGVRKADLVRDLGVNPPQVDRLLDLHHSSKIELVEAALRRLGKRLDVSLA